MFLEFFCSKFVCVPCIFLLQLCTSARLLFVCFNNLLLQEQTHSRSHAHAPPPPCCRLSKIKTFPLSRIQLDCAATNAAAFASASATAHFIFSAAHSSRRRRDHKFHTLFNLQRISFTFQNHKIPFLQNKV